MDIDNDDDGISAEQLDDGSWVWIWQSGGGAFMQGPKHYPRSGAALKAGRRWLEHELAKTER
ncbi:hypothetical protein [Mycolicibacterium sphagni]|uniref:hypothetical protein n=1 Tax=Mycolicibacterium sphagni TaxID=1786 RepID=UPI0021F38132|nr:hypothetical protein [Mycolicibacterium sphagni]MCV7174958.1 hypothetical protein [Mycolicibacterium sphagni]